jgi:hypothetical protein
LAIDRTVSRGPKRLKTNKKKRKVNNKYVKKLFFDVPLFPVTPFDLVIAIAKVVPLQVDGSPYHTTFL